MPDGAESARKRDLRKNNVMRQMGASNLKPSLLSGARNGIPRTSVYVDIVPMAKNLANGAITIVCNVVNRSPKGISKKMRESQHSNAVENNYAVMYALRHKRKKKMTKKNNG